MATHPRPDERRRRQKAKMRRRRFCSFFRKSLSGFRCFGSEGFHRIECKNRIFLVQTEFFFFCWVHFFIVLIDESLFLPFEGCDPKRSSFLSLARIRPSIHSFLVVLALPLASTSWFDQHIQSFPHCNKWRWLISATSRIIGKNSRERQEWNPGAAGWEARMLPLCHATSPPTKYLLLYC